MSNTNLKTCSNCGQESDREHTWFALGTPEEKWVCSYCRQQQQEIKL